MNEKDTDVRLSVQSLRLISSLETPQLHPLRAGRLSGAFQSNLSDTSRVLKTKGLRCSTCWLLQPRHAAAEDNSSLEHTKAEKLSANQGARNGSLARWWTLLWQCFLHFSLGSQTATNVTVCSQTKVNEAVLLQRTVSDLYNEQWRQTACIVYLSNSKKFLRLPVHLKLFAGQTG